ncbi:MAG: carbamoyltransferase [Deltaproteobacteria bacterium]|nr:MAG: carbamoyltransferase [Deltaproteobacteria bacterium]
MKILGISAFYHDSAACLVEDGDIVAAAQEERFTRKKHDFDFPYNAITYCLSEGGVKGEELDYVAFYDKPLIKFERILESYLAYSPAGVRSFLKAMPIWLRQKLWLPDLIRKGLEGYEGKILFPEHHESHAASAFFPSPFSEAAFITLDGVGEWTTTAYGIGRDNKVEIIAEIKFPHSLGLLYSAFTYYLGFRVNSGEYKVMGLAPYGEPGYADLIKQELIDIREDGSFRLNMKYFNYCAGLTMTNKRFDRLFGKVPRRPESEITQKDMDIARSVQVVCEEVMLKAARHVHKVTGMRRLCLAGGVALNCVGNGRILREGPFEDIWIQPAAGDAGGALGAALHVWYQYLGNKREVNRERDFQKASYLGPGFSDGEIEKFLISREIPYRKLNREEIPREVARLIADEKVVGWFQGRMEFGPRALGARSILGDARSPEMQLLMNLRIKFRESFRPFAPSVIVERAADYFEIDRESPYMLLVVPVRKEVRRELTDGERNKAGMQRLYIIRSEIPAVTHLDYSARLQTVKREDNPLYYDLMREFEKLTGCPVVVNTSFNVRGEPIVCSPEHAYLCFMRTGMDYLMMGSYLLDKRRQPEFMEKEDWREDFVLD